MADETPVVAVETPAATPENVAAPAPDTQAAPEVKTEAETKSFTQAELDEIIQKEKAKAEAKAERRALKAYRETLERIVPQQQAQSVQQQSAEPQEADYATAGEYAKALVQWDRSQREVEQRSQQEQSRAKDQQATVEKIFTEARKIPGFDLDEFRELPISQAVADAIVASDVGAKVVAFLGANPDEADRIAKLSPVRQIAEIGKIEDKIAAAPQVSKAPPPMKPVGGKGSANNGDPAKASMDEYIEQRRKQGARWAR